LELVSFAKYGLVGAAAAWLVAQLPVETPLVSAGVKGSLILALYTVVLFVIDKRVRELLSNIWTALTGQSDRKPVLEPMPAATERT
jgi:hypothetical protein